MPHASTINITFKRSSDLGKLTHSFRHKSFPVINPIEITDEIVRIHWKTWFSEFFVTTRYFFSVWDEIIKNSVSCTRDFVLRGRNGDFWHLLKNTMIRYSEKLGSFPKLILCDTKEKKKNEIRKISYSKKYWSQAASLEIMKFCFVFKLKRDNRSTVCEVGFEWKIDSIRCLEDEGLQVREIAQFFPWYTRGGFILTHRGEFGGREKRESWRESFPRRFDNAETRRGREVRSEERRVCLPERC